MPTDIVIVGNSGFARECALLVEQEASRSGTVRLKGFLSFEGYEADLKGYASYFLGLEDDYVFGSGEAAVIGIGSHRLRSRVFAKLAAKQVPFATLISPSATVADSVVLGQANIITNGCFVGPDAVLGNANLCNGLVSIGHDSVIGDGNFFGPASQVQGNVRIGNGNSIATQCAILAHARIGDNNILAPQSVVYKGCTSGNYLMGNPARVIGTVA
ncbi:MAG: hypothetical protein IJU37_00410 [Desulfovibrio sp.]|nr:hypothetical protein [Desulfovibrio sp.]